MENFTIFHSISVNSENGDLQLRLFGDANAGKSYLLLFPINHFYLII